MATAATVQTYRTNANESIVCRHRDLSCCSDCLAADERLVDVLGAVYLIPDPADRAEMLAMVEGL